MSEELRSDAADAADREIMSMTLSANSGLLAGILMGERETGRDPVLSALAASRALNIVVDDIQRSLVRQARGRGYSWAAIGEVLHVSRQAVFQRFAAPADPMSGVEDGAMLVPGAAEAGLRVLDQFLHQRWEEMRAGFDARMSQVAPVEALIEAWEKWHRKLGEIQEIGTPAVRGVFGYTAVDVPLAAEHGDLVCTIVFDADGQVSGFLRKPTEPTRPAPEA